MTPLVPINAYSFPDEDNWERIVDPASGEDIPLPPFTTPSLAISRAQLSRDGDIRKIRLTAAWGNVWPLWENSVGPIAPQDLGISSDLAAHLRRWTDSWIAAADLSLLDGQKLNVHLPPRWFETGEALTRDLAIEIWPIGDVFPYFWRYYISG